MTKALAFTFSKEPFSVDLKKLERRHIYGYIETEALDESGTRCQVAKLAGDGKTLLGTDNTAFGMLSPEGDWRERGELKPVDVDGNEIEPVASSFKAPIELGEEVDVDTYLAHTILSVYHLQSQTLPDELMEKLKKGSIFRFSFSYRGGLEADVAFLLLNPDGELFMLLGKEGDLRFVGLVAPASAEAEDEETGGAEDEMDFGMM